MATRPSPLANGELSQFFSLDRTCGFGESLQYICLYRAKCFGVIYGLTTANRRDCRPANAPQRTRLEELRNDLGHHVSHLNYAERLREGRSIGSGQIEGTCQNLIGHRHSNTPPPAGESAATHSLSRVCPPHGQPLLHHGPPPSGTPTGANTPHETEIRSYTHELPAVVGSLTLGIQ